MSGADQRADKEFDELSRHFNPDELDVVVRYLNAVRSFYTLR